MKPPKYGAVKPTSYTLGTADNIVKFDDKFTIVTNAETNESETVSAVSNDDYAEFQGNWWMYSEKDANGADISLTYNTITLVYEYDNSETPETSETTEPSQSPETPAWGDADCDGKVDVMDIILLNKALRQG